MVSNPWLRDAPAMIDAWLNNDGLCPVCNMPAEDVQVRPDPFAVEVYDHRGATMLSCAKCHKERLLDV
jgi:hypothetical protein